MKGIKGRFLKRFRSIPSTYTSKHVALLRVESHHEKLSYDRNPQSLPNFLEQGEELESPKLSLGMKNGQSVSNDLDVFEECECGFDDSIPEMESSSSSSSSSISSPTSPRSEINEEIPENGTKNLLEFEQKCPPGGNGKVILYTTSLRGIRKTFEDCNAIKFLLESFRVVYYERDVSMHLEFRDELWGILGGRIIPPRLFIKGRHIGGADEVVSLHERGVLKDLLKGIPILMNASNSNLKCGCCGGVRFLVCSECNGSCKIFKGDDQENGGNNFFGRCPKCNENGLVKCPTCSN